MSKSKTPQVRPPNLQIPADSNELLEKFVATHPDMNKADVVRAALRRFLPRLISGEMIIANGKLVEKSELQAA